MGWLATVLLVLGLMGAAILRRHLHESKLLRLREISHKERTIAMERSLPIPETDASKIDSLLGEGHGPDTNPDSMTRASAHWIRLNALALGLIAIFGGMGLMPALYYQLDVEISGTWAFGLVPIFIGIGLLIFVRLSRELVEKMNGKQESR